MMLRLCAVGDLEGVACKVGRFRRLRLGSRRPSRIIPSTEVVGPGRTRCLVVNPFQEDFQGRCGHRLDRSVYLLGDRVNWFDGRRALR